MLAALSVFLVSLFVGNSYASAASLPTTANVSQFLTSASGDALQNLTPESGVAGVLSIILGFLALFFGIRLFKPMMAITGALFGAIIGYLIISAIEQNGTDYGSSAAIVYLVVPCVFGLVFAALCIFIWRLGLALLGALSGFSLALFLLSWQSGGLIPDKVGQPLFLAAFAIIGAILAFILERHVIILGTAFFGSTSLFLGIDFFALTGYTDNVRRILYNNGSGMSTSAVVPGAVIGMLCGQIVVIIIGALVQYRVHGHHGSYSEKSSKR